MKTLPHTLFLKKRNAQSRMAPKSAASVQNSLASATLHCLIDDQNALVTNFKRSKDMPFTKGALSQKSEEKALGGAEIYTCSLAVHP